MDNQKNSELEVALALQLAQNNVKALLKEMAALLAERNELQAKLDELTKKKE